MAEKGDWNQPLLARSTSPVYYSEGVDPARGSNGRDEKHYIDDEVAGSCYIENDAIPETTSLERCIGWSSVHILVISRVVGSGIFATPGLIFRSVVSIGPSFLLWIVGAFAAWLGLTVALEYGCMLPRSGGSFVMSFGWVTW
jgi:amino acid permease-like protein